MPAISKIALGTVQFGLDYGINNTTGKPGQQSVNNILDYAFNSGIRLLDTAEAYGDSHEAIGRYHASGKNRFKVVTKFGGGRTDLPQVLRSRITKDLGVLEVSSLYGYMFHSYGDFNRLFDHFKSDILAVKNDGLIEKFGVSVYTNEEALAVMKHNEVDFIQLPFNLLDNNKQRGIVLREARERNIEVHTRSVFLQGLFFKDIEALPEHLLGLKGYLKEIRKIASDHQIDVSKLSLNYVLQQELVDFILIGVDTVQQLKGNLDAIETLEEPVLRMIDKLDVANPVLLNPSTWKK